MAKILELWRRTRGDGTELERVVRPHLPALFRLACRLTGSESDAEDLLQDLLVRLHGRAAGIGALRRPDLWLSRVLYRLFVDEHRRQRLRPLPVSELHGGPDDPVSAARSTPELETGARAERAFEAARLQRALDALPEDQRTVVLLHDVEGYRLAELAEVLDTPVGTLKSRLHRARRRLRDRLIEGTFQARRPCRGKP